MVTYMTCANDVHLKEIIDLQKRNHPSILSPEERSSQGYVTLKHDVELLKKLGRNHGHTIALDENKVVGFALFTSKDDLELLPALKPIIDAIENVEIEGVPTNNLDYFIMGQICIAKSHRGQGLFRGLYDHLHTRLSDHFDYDITVIYETNSRSIRAHGNYGFRQFHKVDDSLVVYVGI